MGDILAAAYTAYEAQRSRPGFFAWLEALGEFQRMAVLADTLRILRVKNGGPKDTWGGPNNGVKTEHLFKPSEMKAFMSGVRYLTKAQRQNYKVTINQGMAHLNGLPLHTGSMRTVFMGDGFAIWVMSSKGRLYIGPHVAGIFHHSSFKAGGDVMCGGEAKFVHGVPVFLSAKSGHYKPTTDQFRWAIARLSASGLNLQQTKILVWSLAPAKPLVVDLVTLLRGMSYYNCWGDLTAQEKGWLHAGQWNNFGSA